MPESIQIFRAGQHLAANGKTYVFSDQDVADIAASYDPSKHEAPIVIGHPKTDAPAYGWVGALTADKGELWMQGRQVMPAFADGVAEGRYKKRSAALFAPDDPNNPTPGHYYLRHVGYLGAQPPAIKGLPDQAHFAETDQPVVIEFSGHSKNSITDRAIDLLRAIFVGHLDSGAPEFAETELSRLLNGLIDSDKGDRADVIRRMAKEAGIDAGTVEQILNGRIARPPEKRLAGFARVLGVSLARLKNALPKREFSESTDIVKEEGTDMPAPKDNTTAVEFAQKKQELDDQAAEIQRREDALAAKESTQRRAELTAFAEGLADAGKVLPRHQPVIVELLDQLATKGEQVAFAQGEAKQAPDAALREFLESLPEQIQFAEKSADQGDAGQRIEFNGPANATLDPARLDLHRKATIYATQNNCDYAVAVQALGG